MHINNLNKVSTAVLVFRSGDEAVLPHLDCLCKERFNSKAQDIWTDVTEYWDDHFMGDMDALNIILAYVVMRVIDHVPQMAKFVKKVTLKHFTYESNGSVYFDKMAFEKVGNTYENLKPYDPALPADDGGSPSIAREVTAEQETCALLEINTGRAKLAKPTE